MKIFNFFVLAYHHSLSRIAGSRQQQNNQFMFNADPPSPYISFVQSISYIYPLHLTVVEEINQPYQMFCPFTGYRYFHNILLSNAYPIQVHPKEGWVDFVFALEPYL